MQPPNAPNRAEQAVASAEEVWVVDKKWEGVLMEERCREQGLFLSIFVNR